MINFLKGGICMAKRIEKTNYWNQKVKYLGMHSAQSVLVKIVVHVAMVIVKSNKESVFTNLRNNIK